MQIKDYTNAASVREAYEKVLQAQEKLNASISFIDPEEQLQAVPEGKLQYMPIAIKDNFNVKGMVTTAASRILDNYVSQYDATVIEKLRAAGAVMVCKSNLDELAMGGTNLTSFAGAVHNPYDLERISGGSSGGSAVLVACGAVPAALGSDTGDSVRKPASFCGVVGVKPSYGRISRFGLIPYASSLDHVGYFTNNVADAAKMLEVLAGRDDRDMTSSDRPVENYSEAVGKDIKGKKILVFGNVIDALPDSETKALFNKYVKALEEKGAVVKTVHFDPTLMRAILPVYYIIANAEATANHSNLDGINFGHRVEADSADEIMTATRTRGFGPWIKKRFVIGSYALFEENQERIFRKAQKIRRLIVDEVLKELKEADALIAPASGAGAPLIEGQSTDELSDEYLIAENHMVIENFAGLPSMTVPMGLSEGLPVGLNISCNAFREADMFSIAAAVEEISGLKGNVKEDY
ncbi:MAG: aspartyl/glutamyl-tRNA amidotransferase subunit A [Erysipelotrichaceae bacterium]|nr:aspartyl/glutamyl-tRNA amidotransferase subunit A [Erysipelotrichaceae bacterium]